jgi:two-component system sensor histidine kinase AtoS
LRPLRHTLRSLDLWLGGVLLAGVVATLILLFWFASRVSRPLAELAEKTKSIDLQSLDADFATDREDEVGVLSRFLASMLERLRSSVLRLREVERRATLGELARQVNHDIRNGLTPLRNALRHLSQVAREEPENLSRVYGERVEGIDTSLSYLENLAANYARLSVPRQPQPCDLNRTVHELAEVRSGMADLVWRIELSDRPARVFADPVALRRILENVTANAVEALKPGGGTIRLRTEVVPGSGDSETVRVTVEDDGPGIPDEVQKRIFDDFYTTKAHGAGLGLSIVRRLVTDAQGSLQVRSTVGKGTAVRIEFPAHRTTEPGGERAGDQEVGS